MPHTAVRLLSLLSLLQCQRSWTGAELAERLGVSTRTVRNDVERLRELGYAVEGSRGGDGGYRLGSAGAAVPPLLLDPEEATAVAVGLRTGLNCIIGGMEETSMRALAKLEQTLPGPVRLRVRNLNRYTVPLPANHPMPIVDPSLLTRIVELCDSRQRFCFRYADPDQPSGPAETDPEGARFEVEPYRLVNRRHRWYLLAFDVAAGDWAVFDVERIRPLLPAGRRFTPRELPTEDLASYVAQHGPDRQWRHRATVLLRAAAVEVQDRLTSAEGAIVPIDEQTCRLTIGAESLRTIALTLGRIDVDFVVLDPPELRAEIRRVADRFAQATQTPGPADTPRASLRSE